MLCLNDRIVFEPQQIQHYSPMHHKIYLVPRSHHLDARKVKVLIFEAALFFDCTQFQRWLRMAFEDRPHTPGEEERRLLLTDTEIDPRQRRAEDLRSLGRT